MNENAKRKVRLAVFASHGGSDMQAIIDGCKSGAINAEVVLMVSNNSDSFALERAKMEGVDHYHLSAKKLGGEEPLCERLLELLFNYRVDWIFLAGYMRPLHPRILRAFPGRVLNIHPALLPKYGGKGMFGIHVHEAVIAAKEKESGVTIHYVSEIYDSGSILAQTKVPVEQGDTPESLAARVLEREHAFLVEVLGELFRDGL